MTIHMKSLLGSFDPQPKTMPGSFNLKHALMRSGLRWYARVAPEKAGRLVNRQFFRPGRLPMPSRYEYMLDLADSHAQLRHGANIIPLYSWGEGPAVLFVHDWSGAGIQFGAFIDPLVEAGYRVVLFDAPAHGRAQGSTTDLFEMAEITRRVGRSHGPVHGLVAHGLGNLAAVRALSNGLETNKLVMLAPPADLSSMPIGLERQMALPREVLRIHRSLVEDQFGADVWSEFSLVHMAGHLNQSGLVVIDTDDREVPPAHSEQVYEAWCGADAVRTRGQGHHRMLWNKGVVETITGVLLAT